MPLIDVVQAAKRLGVNEQRIRKLAADGRLPARKLGNRWLIESEQLRGRAVRPGRGRPFSDLHAMGLLFLASDEAAPWLSRYEEWRLRRYALPRLSSLRSRLHARADVAFYRAQESAVRRLYVDSNLVLSGVSAAERYGADIQASGVLDAYCDDAHARAVVRRYALQDVPEQAANVVLRSVRHRAPLEGRRVMPRSVVAFDLADSSDSRTQRAGHELLTLPT